MANRQLDESELVVANTILATVREELRRASNGDASLLFALRRKVAKELVYDERSKPAHRRKLKKQKRIEQNDICPICKKELPEKYVVLDRFKAEDGYTSENTRLIHNDCDRSTQESRNFK